MNRVPIRLRLSLVFLVVMTLILFAAGLFIYTRSRDQLDGALNQDLRSRAAILYGLVDSEDSGVPEMSDLRGSGLALRDEGSRAFVQVVDPAGAVLVALPATYPASALTPDLIARAVKRPLLLDTRPPGSAQTFRVYARSIPAPRGRREVALVAISLAGRDAALAGLLRVLLIAGPAALLLAVAGAYVLAAAALRPVSSMSRRAMSISSASAGERLPVPPARDEIARLGESLNEMLDRLEAAARHERAFVADASHELRTPLGVIKTELELAMTSGRSPQELRAALASIAEENDRTVALADGLLFLAHADEKRLPLRVQRLAVGEIFEDLRERYRQRLRDRRGLLAIEPTVGIYVCADRLRITQALTNLIDNALKYGDGEVCLMADATESGVRLHVQDHGSGFPKAFLPRAFDRFARASAGLGGADGTGLGLAIVKAIAEAHGGDAHAANGVWGAHVWIFIPQRHEPAIDPARASDDRFGRSSGPLSENAHGQVPACTPPDVGPGVGRSAPDRERDTVGGDFVRTPTRGTPPPVGGRRPPA